MLVLGAVAIAWSFAFSPAALVGAGGFLAYGIGGAVWIMVFVCPYCGYYNSRGCPCGYGVLSARLVRQGEQECFAQKFKRHIPVIVPLWLVPAACAAVALFQKPSLGLGVLTAAFVLNSYVILPLVSRGHSCSECPQKDGCPWMASGKPVPQPR
jgi:hypothetical protein